MLIEEVINKAIADKNKKRGKSKATSFWVSSAYSCNRKRYWARNNEPKTNPPAPRALRVFHVGDMFHAWIQKEIKKYAAGFEVEYYIKDDKTFGETISGYIDCIARFNSKTTLYEFKSINSRGFKFLAKKKYGASPSHIMQAMTYLSILKTTKEKKIDNVRIVYVDKDSLRVKEVEIPANKKILKAVKDDWKECMGFWKKKQLPPAKPKSGWECSYCPFRKKCKELEKKNAKQK